MVATENRSGRRKRPYIARTGTLDADLQAIGVLRTYVLAADEQHTAEQHRDSARDAVDDAAGEHQVVTYAGEEAWRFEPTTKRTADLDRLKARHPEVYADVVTEAPGYRLVVGVEFRRLLRLKTWRAALRRRATGG